MPIMLSPTCSDVPVWRRGLETTAATRLMKRRCAWRRRKLVGVAEVTFTMGCPYLLVVTGRCGADQRAAVGTVVPCRRAPIPG